MNTYEIEIFNMVDDTEMHTVQTALSEAGITGEDVDGIGIYLQNNKPRSVFVDPSHLGRAVEIINSLGYETDEDVTTEDSEVDLSDYNPDFETR
jgi:hypothetical protein